MLNLLSRLRDISYNYIIKDLYVNIGVGKNYKADSEAWFQIFVLVLKYFYIQFL